MSTVDYASHFAAGATFAESVAAAQKNKELWEAVYRTARVDELAVARAAALGVPLRLLVLSEDWCGDAVNTVPYLVRLAELAGGAARVLRRDLHPEIMDAHLTNGARAIPVVIALDDAFREIAWWGPRPAELQLWRLTEGAGLEPGERYKRLRTWYARDRGRSTVNELLMAIEDAREGEGSE